jgi:hypothetical protein
MANPLTFTEHQVTRNGKQHTVRIWSAQSAETWWQVINPKTGKGWQARRNVQTFHGERAVPQAMCAWLKATRT